MLDVHVQRGKFQINCEVILILTHILQLFLWIGISQIVEISKSEKMF